MSFKLAFKNMKKNMKDYVIYFLTLVLGVAIFYIFNSMDSQQSMLIMSESKRQIVEIMIEILGIMSIFVSIVLAFLILYANNFLIKRRNKEFGLYMLLGMGKRKISGILLIETVLIGIFSLVVGLIVGIFGSQLMSILVARLFEADMKKFEFIFSQAALIKTILYFGVIYGFVMIINLFKTSKYKLIDLINSARKNEKIKVKNTVLSIILFIISTITLGSAYYLAVVGMQMGEIEKIVMAILFGIVGTFLFFYSLAGFILKLIQTKKSFYQKNLNMFVVKQINSKVNTTVFSMSIICILLFLTICIFSSAMSLNTMLTSHIKELTPADISIKTHVGMIEEEKKALATEKYITKSLQEVGLNLEEIFSQYVETQEYSNPEISIKSICGNYVEGMPEYYKETIMTYIKLSDYNKIAEVYGKEKITLEKDEYAILCNVAELKPIYEKIFKDNQKIQIGDKILKSKYKECIQGSTSNDVQPLESGQIIVPDDIVKQEDASWIILNANYKGKTEEEKIKIEAIIEKTERENEEIFRKLFYDTKMDIYESATSLSAIVTFIGLYLGITFLISSAAILALKELSDSSDNKQRYDVLRKIGVDEKMINRALFFQIGIFFIIPLLLACIHSIFGLKVAEVILSMFGKQDIMGSIIVTAIFIVCIYGGYFIATYIGSKNIIKENNTRNSN